MFVKGIEEGAYERDHHLYHPNREVLPRVLFNKIQPNPHASEQKIVALAEQVGIDAHYEPFLFQMWDAEFGNNLGTAPDIWFPSLSLIVEIGRPASKSRKIRLLRESFPYLRFGLLQNKDIKNMPDFKSPEQFGFWLGERIARNDQELSKLTKGYVCSFAYRCALNAGATPKIARLRAKKARRKL